MKSIKFLTAVFILFSILPVQAGDIPKGSITKCIEKPCYKVLKTTFDYTPIREAADSDSKRFTHIKSGINLYSKNEKPGFYELDLGLNKPYWIEKRYVHCENDAADKKLSKVSKIKFYENKNNYFVKIKTKTNSPYKVYQNKDGLQFKYYNADASRIFKKDANYKKVTEEFNYSFEKSKNDSDILTVRYQNNAPVYAYDVKKKNNLLVFQIRKPLVIDKNRPLKGLKIALDPGHGGNEKGCVSGGFYEKDVNFQITKELNNILKQKGAKTMLTRNDDIDTGLYERVDSANKFKADFLISIHQNSLPNPKNYHKRHGAGVYYYNENAKNLAYIVQKNIVKSTGFKDDGVFNASFALTRSTSPVSILVECGYLIHPYERKKLTDPKFQKIMANSIAAGIEEYLKSTAN